MKVTLNYKDYLNLLGHVGELQGLVGGLLMYSCIPEDVKTRGRERLDLIKSSVDSIVETPKEYPNHAV
ncbi:hypothetical protein [Hymenobacter mellowenesis]|uniref:hypothetical protein n=1 Tax=Hymenobacter mellowenesis TaxID=3063995 RepID=UPI00272A37D1|nr:hypothetical protein [Hymenobacter sp. M29]